MRGGDELFTFSHTKTLSRHMSEWKIEPQKLILTHWRKSHSTFSWTFSSAHSFILIVSEKKVSENPVNIFQKSFLFSFSTLCTSVKWMEKVRWVEFEAKQTPQHNTIHCNFMKMRILLCQQHVYVVEKRRFSFWWYQRNENQLRQAAEKQIINFHKTWKIFVV